MNIRETICNQIRLLYLQFLCSRYIHHQFPSWDSKGNIRCRTCGKILRRRRTHLRIRRKVQQIYQIREALKNDGYKFPTKSVFLWDIDEIQEEKEKNM